LRQVVSKRSPKGVSQAADESPRARLLSFVLEQHPFALPAARSIDPGDLSSADALRSAGDSFASKLASALRAQLGSLEDLPETTPFVSGGDRFEQEITRLEAGVRGFFEREALKAEITDDDRRAFLEGIVLTRAVDNRMKQMFLSSELRYGALGFQGKGFRSLGQEAIFAACWRLKKGEAFAGEAWRGDVVGPLIRDLGVVLAFTDDVHLALNAQAGKVGPPLGGKDLHVGDLSRGVLPAAAPLSIATCTVVGCGLAMTDDAPEEARVAVSFIGEGGSSLGEWHESINLAAAKKLPVLFCLQNNQTALSTRVDEQTAARVFGEKAAGYGIPHVTVDGTDPEEIAAAFAWAADRARRGEGPALLELVAMRMCGHAHHDDMLYLGGDPELAFELPPQPDKGYVNAERYADWAGRDPLASYAGKLLKSYVVSVEDVDAMKATARRRCDEAMDEIKARDWPDAADAGRGLYADGPVLAHAAPAAIPALPAGDAAAAVEDAPAFTPKGSTYLEGVALGVGDALDAHERAFVLGEDVGAPYGNAFLLLKSLVDKHADRLWNAPIAEGGIIGACVGAALMGMRPIGEMQFNDFVASGFNELVNNAAKLRYRTGMGVPMVLRMPWGGLRRAGPYHSQDTAPWFFRTFGLKIVAPSTPHDARALMRAAAADPDPVLFYEHIALYRDPKIKQSLDEVADIPLGKAAIRRQGEDLTILSYGAYVHRALAAAAELEKDGWSVEVVDLRSLSPLDWGTISGSVGRTGKVLLVGEDSRTGSILESIASRISESMYEDLDGPVRVLGALDTPVPYAPSLEDAFLVSAELLRESARALLEY
jgi:2-oxoisovalerate dehydrogenase E1 component